MGWEGIGDVLGTIFIWVTPELVKARVKDKIKRLKNEQRQLLKKDSTTANIKRLDAIERELDKLQSYLNNR